MPKTGSITGAAGKRDGGHQTGAWGQLSVDGEDTITSPERGPLGPGGSTRGRVLHFEAEYRRWKVLPKARANAIRERGMSGSDLSRKRISEGSQLN